MVRFFLFYEHPFMLIRYDCGYLNPMRYLFLSVVIAFGAEHSLAQETPCPRNQPVIAYRNSNSQIYLFGGYCGEQNTRLNDLWAYDGSVWNPIETEKDPDPRSGHSMIYDSQQDLLIVFGGKGNDGVLLNDLWSWDGEVWKLLKTDGPPARQSHRMVYNSDKGEYFLFGGSDVDGNSMYDTWVYGHGEWKEVTTSSNPASRLQHTMVYDQKRQKVILFGGFGRDQGQKTVLGDTWEWDDSSGWEQKDNNLQLARDHHAMGYNQDSGTTMIFGGYNQGYFGDTWHWSGEEWQQIHNNGPARAGKPGMIYDQKSKKLVLFGGGDRENMNLMDFWVYNEDDNQWELATPGN